MGCHLWKCLVVLRLVWTLLPQTGYIHPDEFFQSVEVVAGDVFDIEVHRTWEFNSTSPLRSITFPYLISWLPFYVLGFLHSRFPDLSPDITSYQLIVLPRLVMCILSITVDIFVAWIADHCHLDRNLSVLLLASSYVTLTFLTRTFSNSSECLIFVVVLYLLIKSHRSFSEPMREGKSPKTNKNSPSSIIYFSRLHAAVVASMIIVGFFNRATFLIFIAIPFLWWFYKIVVYFYLRRLYAEILTLISILSLSSVVTFLFFCITDTLYYRGITLSSLLTEAGLCLPPNYASIHCMRDIISDHVVAPWNFIIYNSNSSNIKDHGSHPHYLHVIGNMPLLFGPFCIFPILKFSTKILDTFSEVKSDHCVPFHVFLAFPLIVLSLFPHQEARFLLPLLPIVVLISTSYLRSNKLKNIVLPIWVIFNLFLSMFFGILHQGGIIPAISHLQQQVRHQKQHRINAQVDDNYDMQTFVIFHHTYMPPQHLFFDRYGALEVVDLKGDDFVQLENRISDIRKRTLMLQGAYSL